MAADVPRGAAKRAQVYSIAPGRPFLATLARAILAGDLPRAGGAKPSDLELSAITILLPSRRAQAALQDAFLAASGGRAMLLPRMRAFGETEEDAALIADAAGLTPLGAAADDIPAAISPLERRLQLTSLVLRWAELGDTSKATPAQAFALAGELGRLLDTIETEGAKLDTLPDLVHPTLAEHWAQTVQFLDIVTKFWPAYLTERELISQADRQNRLLRAEAARLMANPPPGPVIVAGATGSIPATAELMAVIARLPQGAVVLPGLDFDLDAEGWDAIRGNAPNADAKASPSMFGETAAQPAHAEHPQFSLQALLDALGLDRHDILEVAGAPAPAGIAARSKLISEAMRPARTTHRWHAFTETADRTEIKAGLAGLTVLEAATAPDEAEAIALILREAVETPGQTAALISPDRLLARRVATRLLAFGIDVDDSAGRPLAKTNAGTFLELIIAAAGGGFAPQATMALLKHPLATLGLAMSSARRAARVIELVAFRTLYLGSGLEGIETAVELAAITSTGGERKSAAVRRLTDADWTLARDYVQRLRAALGGMEALFLHGGKTPLRTFVGAHAAAAEALGATVSGEPTSTLWSGEAGLTISQLLTSLADPDLPSFDLAPRDYPDVWRALVADTNVRERRAVHPRITISGPFEARLQQPDVVVIGGLNDGTWPASADPGPWLNRGMRAALGLPAPEATIGRGAHDFTMLLGAPRVHLTRAAKVDGVPSVPSRWLMRIGALLGGLELGAALDDATPWLAWAAARDAVTTNRRIAPPAPNPPVALRPRKLPVTAIERWIANPYAIFAERVLGLAALEPLGREPDAQLKGSLVHAVLRHFSKDHPRALPPDIAAVFIAIIGEVVAEHAGNARVAAFWVPRFSRIAQWFAATEPGRREGLDTGRVHSEIMGSLMLDAPFAPFELTARADRIDAFPGGLVLMDYKTGEPPKDAQVLSGASPQLPLEAAIAKAGGFTNIKAKPIAALVYISVSGGEPPGKQRTIDTSDPAGLADAARQALERLIAEFDDPATPYRALRRDAFANAYRFDAYAHLARVAEWSGDDGGAGGEG